MKRETRNNTMQRKSSGMVRHRKTKVSVKWQSRKERIQHTLSHGEAETWLGMENIGVGNMIWLAVKNKVICHWTSPLQWEDQTWMLHDRKITELRYGKWRLCRPVFWRERIIRLGETSAKGEPWCLWAIRSQQGDVQLHITAQGRAVFICPWHSQRARPVSHRRSWSGGYGA